MELVDVKDLIVYSGIDKMGSIGAFKTGRTVMQVTKSVYICYGKIPQGSAIAFNNFVHLFKLGIQTQHAKTLWSILYQGGAPAIQTHIGYMHVVASGRGQPKLSVGNTRLHIAEVLGRH